MHGTINSINNFYSYVITMFFNFNYHQKIFIGV